MPVPLETTQQGIDIHQDDTDQRDTIYNQNCTQIQGIKDALDNLMPLVPLIEPLQQIVKREYEQAVVSKRMVKIGKTLGFIASVVTAIGIIFGAAWIMIEAIIRIKE